METIDCQSFSTREINQKLKNLEEGEGVELIHPMGRHNLAVGLQQNCKIKVKGHTGYYYGGMNQHAEILIEGNAGQGVGENMMSGKILVEGYASAAAGSSAHGGTLVIEKSASLRCGISLKGGDILVRGNVGNMCGFMAQAGHILICGDAGEALGDCLYEAIIYIKGQYQSLGADAKEEPLQDVDRKTILKLLKIAGWDESPGDFKKVVSAKTLYHFDATKNQTY